MGFKHNGKLSSALAVSKGATVQLWLLAKQEEGEDRGKGLVNQASNSAIDCVQFNRT